MRALNSDSLVAEGRELYTPQPIQQSNPIPPTIACTFSVIRVRGR